MNRLKLYIVLLNLFFCINISFSLELTVTDVAVIRIGVVDMDEVLRNFQKLQIAEQTYTKIKEEKQKEISGIEQELDNLMKKKILLQTEISVLESQIQQLTLKTTSYLETVSSDEHIQQIKNNIETKQKNLDEITTAIEEKKIKIAEKKNEMEVELQKYKEKEISEIYSIIYRVIEKIALEEKLNIIIDKSGILYGIPEIEITDKVIKYLKK